jgi:hypothetical protein
LLVGSPEAPVNRNFVRGVESELQIKTVDEIGIAGLPGSVEAGSVFGTEILVKVVVVVKTVKT